MFLFLCVLVNVNKSFLDAANKEKLREREALESGLMFSRDRLFEMIPVSTLICYTLISVRLGTLS